MKSITLLFFKRFKMVLVAVLPLMIGCVALKTTKKNKGSQVNMPAIEVVGELNTKRYNPAKTRKVDLLHMKLDISPDWKKQRVQGSALLRFTPYFYPIDSVFIDAKGFLVHDIELWINEDQTIPLAFSYDSLVLSIALDKTYSKTDTFGIFINYTARPNEFESAGSQAITSDKGLYFINPTDSNPNHPKQLWSQGETESNSRWFPTIDAPNEKITHEIRLTVEAHFQTISNGELIYSMEHENKTRTDYWKMDKPHAPYLVMIAVGDFALVEDEWEKNSTETIPVNYYLDSAYKPYAMDIFGKTPEMLSFFSNILSFPFPWPKYDQLAVHEFVSGAMENTTAVVHGDFVQQTPREMLDYNYEDYVSHELFHHWFGDLVTCESWANLPLNEAFATYGEYLWREYKYGTDAAEENLLENHVSYLNEAHSGMKNLIRYNYHDKEDMFDHHSYAKGGSILHMLRVYLGDQAFFQGLSHYLTKHQFQTVEAHDFRIAMEEVVGEDLNWFFNQWFFNSGHPLLKVDYGYNSLEKTYTVLVNQEAANGSDLTYHLPLKTAFYFGDTLVVKKLDITSKVEAFKFSFHKKPDAVVFDYDGALLCEIEENKTLKEYLHQSKFSGRLKNRLKALEEIAQKADENPQAMQQMLAFLSDSSWALREICLNYLEPALHNNIDLFIDKIKDLAQNDEKSNVRAAALSALKNFASKQEDITSFFLSKLDDPSYLVLYTTLTGINEMDSAKAQQIALSMINEENITLKIALAEVLSASTDTTLIQYYTRWIKDYSGYELIPLIARYFDYLENKPDAIIEEGLAVMHEVYKTETEEWVLNLIKRKLAGLREEYNRLSAVQKQSHQALIEKIELMYHALTI